MAAPKGNKFWMMAPTTGRKVKYDNPQDLLSDCLEYFAHVEKNPIIEQKAFCSNGVIKYANIEKMRAMTVAGLAVFLGISRRTWTEWREERKDLSPVIEYVDSVMTEQKLTGAAAGVLNANIIARELGLADKTENDHRSSDGSMSAGKVEVNITKEGMEDILKML